MYSVAVLCIEVEVSSCNTHTAQIVYSKDSFHFTSAEPKPCNTHEGFRDVKTQAQSQSELTRNTTGHSRTYRHQEIEV